MVTNKEKINKEKLRNTLNSMASLFETGRIKKMKELSSMYPTGIVALLGINYGGFMTKCSSPEKFVVEDLVKLSKILNVELSLIMKVVEKEALENTVSKSISDYI